MALRITIDIFSGRPNPVIEVNGAQAREFLERVTPAKKLKRGEMPVPDWRLGYRGLLVEQIGGATRSLPATFRVAAGAVFGADLAHNIADPDAEEFFVGLKGPGASVKLAGIDDAHRLFAKEVKNLRAFRDEYERPEHKPKHKPKCLCAPLYEPNWWNDGGQKQWHNNCYNYSTDYRTDTFAQPGRANGAMYTALTCASVRPAAIADALIDSPTANNRCPKEGHLVALVIWPGVDFHWYRKGRDGMWSHKPGPTAVRAVDNSGHTIHDPRVADRGGYVNFCTFMTVMHGHIKLN
jgi:hypothetical protein